MSMHTEPGARPSLVAVGSQVADGAPCSLTTTSLPSAAGELIVRRVGGEVDALTLPGLRAALTRDLDRRPGYLVLDLAELTFCCARGLALLVQTGVTAAENGTAYAVSGMPSGLDRVWMMLWDPADLPVRYRSAAAAVSALGARQATVRD